MEACVGSFEELYELSPTFRMLADDQGVTMLDSPRPITEPSVIETSSEPVTNTDTSILYAEQSQ